MEKYNLFDEFYVGNEYHQAALYTYGKESNFERKFRYKLLKIKRKVRRVDRNFGFDLTTEMIKIDYSLFGIDIVDLLLKDFDLLSRVEFNFVSHYCSGGMFVLYDSNEIELRGHKDYYLHLYDTDYISIRRMALINDLINS